MKQAFTRFARLGFRPQTARALFLSTAISGSAYMMYRQNMQMPAFSGVQADCLWGSSGQKASSYVVPSESRVAECKQELMSFCSSRRNMAPLLVRLSWHDAGTYDKKDGSGGPRGCMRNAGGEASHGANAGLGIARDLLAPVKSKFEDFSHADFWSLAAVCAIKVMGGPDIPWRAGRPDATKGDVPDGRLPDATQGSDHLRCVFHRMGFSDQEIVALAGAHAVGMCHGDRSGFVGPWTTTALDFDNAFFVNLTTMKWHKKKQDNGLEVFVTDSQPGIIMLPTDIALITDPKMVCWVELYAKDKQRFYTDFAAAFAKLQELGVSNFHEGKGYQL
jgi:cytochrome c peroxidase